MGRRRTIPVMRVGQFWDALTADYGAAGSYALAIETMLGLTPRRLDFHDEFNRTGVDVSIWTSGGDGGSFTYLRVSDEGTLWRLTTGAVADNDWYIHGDAVLNNKWFTPNEEGCTTVTYKTRMRLVTFAVISSFWGLFYGAITDYVEPPGMCAHFFADPVISNTFRARSWGAAEEETDTLIALDGNLHTFEIIWTAASVLFYIDDVLVATHAAQVPDMPLLLEFLHRTEAAAAQSMDIDYVHVEVT